MCRDQVGRGLDEPTVGLRATAGTERKVDPAVHATLSEMSVGQPVQPVGVEQCLEIAQIGPEPFRGNGCVLPARVRGLLQGHPGVPGRIGSQPPPERRIHWVVHDDGPECAGRPASAAARSASRSGSSSVNSTNSQPRPGGSGGTRAAVRRRRHRLEDARVEAFAGAGGERQHRRHSVGRIGESAESEQHESAVLRLPGELHLGSGDHTQGALRADQEACRGRSLCSGSRCSRE